MFINPFRIKKTIQINYEVIAISIIVLLFLVQSALQTQQKVDWLYQSDWSHFSGANVDDSGVNIVPIKTVINHSDTSTAQPNPPINIGGSHLIVSEDFEIRFEISGIKNEAYLQFYGELPIIYDEWRQERSSLRFEIKPDEVKVRIWDGTAANSIDERTYNVQLGNNGSFGLAQRGKNITILANGKRLGTIPDHGIFKFGAVWFGADAKIDTPGWKLTKLTAFGSKSDSIVLADPVSISKTDKDPDSLRELSQNNPSGIPIGVAVSIIPLLSDANYNQIVLSQFSMITPENSFKPQAIQPLEGVFVFEQTDTLVKAAENNNMLVHGHALVMGKATPEWMQKTPENERKQIMEDHIKSVVGRYKGRVAQWDVVNEPMSENAIDYKQGRQGLREHMWLEAMGEEYIDIAYKTAREADKDAKLFLNDFGLEKDGERWDAFLSLVKRLQSRGVPIDGVGFESHVYHSPADDIDPKVLSRHIKTLAGLGLESRISEIDVLGDIPEFQAKQYSNVLQVCLKEPTCTSYGIWGVTDLYGSTTLSDRYPVVLGDSLLWDTNYTPKPAFKSLQAVLRNDL